MAPAAIQALAAVLPPREPSPRERPQLAQVEQFRVLRDAGALCLHAQPIMDLRGAQPRVARAEFLIRQRDGARGALLPAGMIEALEHFGAATELDAFTTRALLDWLRAQPQLLRRLDGVSLNLSAASLDQVAFMDALLAQVHAAHLPTGWLWFEITETAVLAQPEQAATHLNALRAAGCRFSLDDIGAGEQALRYLDTLPLDEIKIDGRFVQALASDAIARERVRAIHEFACATGRSTVAEFVDTPEKLAALREIGVPYVQGWLFWPALPLDEFLPVVGGS